MQANCRSSCLVPMVLIWHLNYGVDGLAMTMLRHSWGRVRRRSRRLWSVSRNWSIEALLRHTDSNKDHEPSVTAILDALQGTMGHKRAREMEKQYLYSPLLAVGTAIAALGMALTGNHLCFMFSLRLLNEGTTQAAKVDISVGLERTKGGEGVRSLGCYVFEQWMRSDIRVIETCMNSERYGTLPMKKVVGNGVSGERVVTTHGSLRFSDSFAFWQFRDLDQSTGSILVYLQLWRISEDALPMRSLACEDESGDRPTMRLILPRMPYRDWLGNGPHAVLMQRNAT